MHTGQQQHRVLILGGGYAGVMAARRLAKQSRAAAITLVNLSDMFVERIRLHQYSTGQTLRQRPLRSFLDDVGVSFVQGRVTHIAPDAHTITVETNDDSRTLAYDTLVYALGSVTDMRRVAGAAEHALAIGTHSAAEQVRAALQAQPDARITIIGGGLTGIEAATEIAAAYPHARVMLLTRSAFGTELGVSEAGRAYLARTFARMGIDARENTTVTAIHASLVETSAGTFGHDVVLWAGAFAAPPLARDAGLKVNALGQVVVDAELRSVSHPDVVAIGDAADASAALAMTVGMGCKTANPMGHYAGDAIAARLAGTTPQPFDVRYLGFCISLGRDDGLVQWTEPDGTPRESVWTGRLGALVKELVSSGTVVALRLAYGATPPRPAAYRSGAAREHASAKG